MDLVVTGEEASFRLGDLEVGRYVLNDPFKPYLHPLRSPAGHTASLAVPHDHRHHKGLMYALATDDVNFWEEAPTQRFPRIGVQRQESIETEVNESGPRIRQELLWSAVDGSFPTFREERTIRCALLNPKTIRWNWSTKLIALTGVHLRHSEWAARTTDGHYVNYHGLGLRFPRSFGGLSDLTTVSLDDHASTFDDALGAAPSSVTISGQIDGIWPPPALAVRIEQLTTSDAFFVMRDPFTYLSVGPSNRAPVSISEGGIFEASYQIDITDIDVPRP